MSDAIVFETPGLMDVRAFTLIGVHAKPLTDSPIGFFGTGLKYAIAVLVRIGAKPVVWIGRDRFEFSKVESTFRGVRIEPIRMRADRYIDGTPIDYELPYTTDYGKKWEVWQAFRELESNTRDEGGRTFEIDRPDLWDLNRGGPDGDKTYVIVEHPDFVEAARAIDDVFLPRGRRTGDLLEVVGGESERLWYRTMRGLDISKPSIFTYNILEELELTEDRTIKYEWSAKSIVARWVLTAATADQVEAVIKAPEESWERGLEFPGWVKPSAAFEEVMTRRRRGVSRESWAYYGPIRKSSTTRHFNYGHEPKLLMDVHPRPWKVDGSEIVDVKGNAIFAVPDGYDREEWEFVAEQVLERIRVTGGLG